MFKSNLFASLIILQAFPDLPKWVGVGLRWATAIVFSLSRSYRFYSHRTPKITFFKICVRFSTLPMPESSDVFNSELDLYFVAFWSVYDRIISNHPYYLWYRKRSALHPVADSRGAVHFVEQFIVCLCTLMPVISFITYIKLNIICEYLYYKSVTFLTHLLTYINDNVDK